MFKGVGFFSVIVAGFISGAFCAEGEQPCAHVLKKILGPDLEIELQKRALPQSEAQAQLWDVARREGAAVATQNSSVERDSDLKNYSHKVSFGPFIDQANSELCWNYAGASNVEAEVIDRKLAKKGFRISRIYIYYYHLLEQANSYFEDTVISALIEQNKKNRLVGKRLKRLKPEVEDAGDFANFSYLIQKWGAVPATAWPENANSQDTTTLTKDLNDYLSRRALMMLDFSKTYIDPKAKEVLPSRKAELEAQLREMKVEAMAGVARILNAQLGTPPRRLEFTASIGGVKEARSFTPREFARDFLKFDPNDFVNVRFNPFKKRDRRIMEKLEDGPMDASGVLKVPYINMEPERLFELVVASLRAGRTVYTVGYFDRDLDTSSGIMHPRLFNKDVFYGEDAAHGRTMSPGEQMSIGGVEGNHAVLLVGFHQPSPESVVERFLGLNSWQRTRFLHMSREWFMENVTEIVIHRRFLSPEEQTTWDRNQIFFSEE